MNAAIIFTCPRCRGKLSHTARDVYTCPSDGLRFECLDGIWRFLLPERQSHYAQFTHEYEAVRRAEGRGAGEADYYRALPYHDLSRRMSTDWRIRAASFDAFIEHVLAPLEKNAGRPLSILDLGAGNGWLSYRLAQRGHNLAAVDLMVNDFDGLGCYRFYEAAFVPVQAEFERLPFDPHSVDLAIFNASLHYSEDYPVTLIEAMRLLKEDGKLVILDSPVYNQATSGAQMVHEREAEFTRKYGFPSNALNSKNYLTFDEISRLGWLLQIKWEMFTPKYGLRWRLRPVKAMLSGQREPAKFFVLAGSLSNEV